MVQKLMAAPVPTPIPAPVSAPMNDTEEAEEDINETEPQGIQPVYFWHWKLELSLLL
jgi:hypothetical protein